MIDTPLDAAVGVHVQLALDPLIVTAPLVPQLLNVEELPPAAKVTVPVAPDVTVAVYVTGVPTVVVWGLRPVLRDVVETPL